MYGIYLPIDPIALPSLKRIRQFKAPEDGRLEYDRFLLGWPIFTGYVSSLEGTININYKRR